MEFFISFPHHIASLFIYLQDDPFMEVSIHGGVIYYTLPGVLLQYEQH